MRKIAGAVKRDPQGAMALLQYVRVIMSWGWPGEYHFQGKTCIYFSKFAESCRKLSQELQSYYGNSGSIFTPEITKG